jgi:hypothetical protein
MGWTWVCTTFSNNENGGLLKLKLKLSLNGVFSGGSGCTTSPLLLPLLLLRYLCYHYSLLLYHSLSLSLWFFSLCTNQSTHNRHYFSLSFLYQGKKSKTKTQLRKRKKERGRQCVRFFFIYIYIDCGRFCIFCFSFVYDFSFSFQSVRPFRKRYIKKSSVVNIFTKATIHIILFHPKLCYAFLFFILNLDFFFFLEGVPRKVKVLVISLN